MPYTDPIAHALNTDRQIMAIYSMCSDLDTRETMWVARKTETAPQTVYAGQIRPAEGWWWAGCYADRYQEEAVAKLPTFG